MKRIVALLLVFLMLAGSGVLAETLDVTANDFTADVTKNVSIPLELADDASFSVGVADKVDRKGDTYIVRRGDDLTVSLDMSQFSTVLCFTQDLYASFEAYLRTSDPYGLQQELINNGVFFYLADIETGMMVLAYQSEMDSMSSMVGNFSSLSAANQALIASFVASDTSVVKSGDYSWVSVGDSHLLTIFNSQYIIVEIAGTDPSADMEDTLSILSHIQFT